MDWTSQKLEECNSAILEMQVQLALQDLDLDSRREYDLAASAAPELVEKESPPADFLRVERNDPVQAAARICKYWKARKKCFDDRWLLPMNQTGSGALSATDIAVLRSGYIVIMPRPSGGIIALFDESKVADPVAAAKSKMRIIFYFSSLYRACTATGKAIVHVVTSKARPAPLDLQPEEWRIRQQAMPGSGLVKPQLFVAAAYEGSGKQALMDFLAYRTWRAESFKTEQKVCKIVACSVRNTVQQLEQYGLERNLLPRCLGGTFDYVQFDDWIRQRLSVEGGMSAAPVQQLNYSSAMSTTNQQSVVSNEEQETKQQDKNNQSTAENGNQGDCVAATTQLVSQTVAVTPTATQLQLTTNRRSGDINAMYHQQPVTNMMNGLLLQLPNNTEECGAAPAKLLSPAANATNSASQQFVNQQLVTHLPSVPQQTPAVTTQQAIYINGASVSPVLQNQATQYTQLAEQTTSTVASQVGNQLSGVLPIPLQGARQSFLVPPCARRGNTDQQNLPSLTSSTPETPRRRAIRTYQKRNLQVTDLMESRNKLRIANKKLREENRSLEAFLAQARLIVAQCQPMREG